MTNKYTKRCSTSLIIKEIQNKTTMRYHLICVRMAIIKKKKEEEEEEEEKEEEEKERKKSKLWGGCGP